MSLLVRRLQRACSRKGHNVTKIEPVSTGIMLMINDQRFIGRMKARSQCWCIRAGQGAVTHLRVN